MALTYNQIMATTLKYYAPTLAINITKTAPLFERLREKNQVVIDGGERIVVPLEHDYNGTVKSFDGFDELPISDNEIFTAAEYNWKFYNVAISVALTDLAKNRGKHKLIAFLESKIKNAERSLKKTLGTHLYDDGTGNGGKDMLGLKAIVSTTPTVGTLGGIDRSLHSFWQNKAYASAGAWGASNVGRNKLDEVITDIRDGGEVPDLTVTSKTPFKNLKREFANNERENSIGGKGKKPAFGYVDFSFQNSDVVYDQYCPDSTVYVLSTDYIKLYIMQSLNFTTTDAVTPTNQHVKVSHIVVGLQLVASNCQKQAVITGMTTAA